MAGTNEKPADGRLFFTCWVWTDCSPRSVGDAICCNDAVKAWGNGQICMNAFKKISSTAGCIGLAVKRFLINIIESQLK